MYAYGFDVIYFVMLYISSWWIFFLVVYLIAYILQAYFEQLQ